MHIHTHTHTHTHTNTHTHTYTYAYTYNAYSDVLYFFKFMCPNDLEDNVYSN